MLIKINRPNKLLFHLIFSILLITITTCEYRPLDGSGNNRNDPSAGTPQTPFARQIPQNSRYQPGQPPFQMIPTPGNYELDPNVSCTDAVPPDNFPLPRCVSNKITAMRLQSVDSTFNLAQLDKYKSKRRSSHILTYWAFFIRMDTVTSPPKGKNLTQGIYIPTDDQTYLSSYRYGEQPDTYSGVKFFSVNRSVDNPINTGAADHTGINTVTSFLDASTIYGNSLDELRPLRDYNNRGKMRLTGYQTSDGTIGYPPFDPSINDLVVGIKAPTKNVFTDVFTTIFLREHNRLCEEFYAIHGDTWDDEKYFQEARRWVIAYIQKITYFEYLGTALGTPLPPYKGYNATLKPVIDTFFASVTFRYGHSEISDFYTVVNEQRDPLAVLSLHDLKTPNLIAIYGIPSLILTMALQRQEEVDIYFSEFMRSYHSKTGTVDIAAQDILRGRDHGIPSYNDARQAFGLSKKTTWSEISSDPDVQKKLQETYGTVDQIEALMGGLAEDHVNDGNYGELISTSFRETWSKVRDSDRFWYENKEVSGFSDDDISKIQTTTLLDIIKRNTPQNVFYPDNLWFSQQVTTQPSLNNEYGYSLLLADGYRMQWKIVGSDVVFLFTVSSTSAWFAIGFNPNGPAMQDTDMMIFWNKDNTVVGKNYKGIGRAIKPMELPENDQIITINNIKVANGLTSVEVQRPLEGKNRKSLSGQIDMAYAWNLHSPGLSYHGGNRGKRVINLVTGDSSGYITIKQKNLLLAHGIVMFLIWGVLFPVSVWIVRYMRHRDSYMSQHRSLNLLGGAIVAAFGAVAMSAVDIQAGSSHGIVGIIVFTIAGFQIALGLLAIWALANVESAATGIVKYLRHLHFYLGGALLITAWANIYLGMNEFDTKYAGNGKNQPYIWAYTAWLVLFVFVITASEFYYKIKNMQFLWPVKKNDDLNDLNDLKNRVRIRNCIPDEVFDSLPAITWNDFNQKVMTGANLVIAEGFVFDIHKWIPIHPGGQKILQRVIGTDITNDFFFDPSVISDIKENLGKEHNEKISQQSISLLTDNNYRESTQQGQSNRPFSVANAVDMINSTAFKNRRVAMHRHSKFATSKLASMVIARVIDPIDEGVNLNSSVSSTKQRQQKLRDINITILNSDDDVTDLQQPIPYSPHIFRRYILTHIETVSRNESEPVKKFTFQVIHKKDRLPKFLPGDYIEIMSFANNHMVSRPYTPLQGPTKNSFFILVKIYKDGAMSQHLNQQLRNFEIKVRGPFDIADRILQSALSSPTLKPTSISSRPSSPSLSTRAYASDNKFTSAYYERPDVKQRSHYGSLGISRGNSLYTSVIGNSNIPTLDLSNVLGNRSGILLNKEREDLCWDHLFMVCGGTGITPMLQLIQYHMEKAETGSNFNLYLLCANDTISDLIHQKYLDYICGVLRPKLRISYILSKPPPIWKGLVGFIDEVLLFDWISQNYNVPPPAIPPRFSTNYSNIGGGGGGSNTNSILSSSTYIPATKNKNYGKNPINEFEEFEEIIEHFNEPQRRRQQQFSDDEDDPYDHRSSNSNRLAPPSPIQIPVQSQPISNPHSPSSPNAPYYFPNMQQTNEMMLINERLNYMKLLANDNSSQVKLIVCGSSRFNDSIRKSLEKLGFPIEEKALFLT